MGSNYKLFRQALYCVAKQYTMGQNFTIWLHTLQSVANYNTIVLNNKVLGKLLHYRAKHNIGRQNITLRGQTRAQPVPRTGPLPVYRESMV